MLQYMRIQRHESEPLHISDQPTGTSVGQLSDKAHFYVCQSNGRD